MTAREHRLALIANLQRQPAQELSAQDEALQTRSARPLPIQDLPTRPLSAKDQCSSRFLVQAHALLTRRWTTASWRARQDILRAVDWLLTAEREKRMSPADRAERTLRAAHRRHAAPPSNKRRHLAG